jgi:hypothetical protein
MTPNIEILKIINNFKNIIEARNKVKDPEPPLRFLKLIEKPIPRPPTPTTVPRDQV